VPRDVLIGVGFRLVQLLDGFANTEPNRRGELPGVLTAAGVTEVYPGAAHGYTTADSSAYDEGAAERHFTALHRLLARALGKP
jgi:carboxymethylenebutenolidase